MALTKLKVTDILKTWMDTINALIDSISNIDMVKSVNDVFPDSNGNIDVLSLMMPDYSAGVSLSNNTEFTAPSHGIVITNGRYDDTNSYVYVNGIEIIKTYGSSSGNGGDTFTVPVSKGDIIKVHYYRSWTKGTFFPLKGD